MLYSCSCSCEKLEKEFIDNTANALVPCNLHILDTCSFINHTLLQLCVSLHNTAVGDSVPFLVQRTLT
jgi:hypothetical protein